MRLLSTSLGLVAALAALALPAQAAGTLTPRGATQAPIRILDHHVDVVINNGFVRTEVHQTFFNPNAEDLEAVYAFPVPESASLSELTLVVDESELHGEVVMKDEARRIYEEERDAGNDTALAEQESFLRYEISVSPVRAQTETSFRYVYYQELAIDTGVGRYVYPLEDGGTDEAAADFWSTNSAVERSFSFALELKSAWPVSRVRMPGFEGAAVLEQLDTGHHKARLDIVDTVLERDIVFYYKLADDLPGRIEVVPYRDGSGAPGTFMMVVTPGIDLAPLTGGADYVFVLDTSGSMKGKIHTLANGIERVLGELDPDDRFRIVVFNDRAHDLTRGFSPATPDAVARAIEMVTSLDANGSTNLYDGIARALADLEDDRATSVILVTDGVANEGIVSPKAFTDLLKRVDVRVFGFLMGNGANWPLMRTICDTSGGFYAGISNADDILGQIILAKEKVTHECLHDATLEIDGVKVFETTDAWLGKVYRGQQIVKFGRYAKGGEATVSLKARLTGEDRVYSTRFTFPDADTTNPELERLWAMSRIEDLQLQRDQGVLPEGEMRQAIASYGLAYQLVTDETSMLVLDDAAFDKHGVTRDNRDRVANERTAQTARAAQPAQNHRVDRNQGAFPNPAPRPSYGGGGGSGGGGMGAVDPLALVAAAGLAALALLGRRAQRSKRSAS